jgi:hypothetical protein
MNIELSSVTLPDFGLPCENVEIPRSGFSDRLNELEDRLTERNFDAAVVHAARPRSPIRPNRTAE